MTDAIETLLGHERSWSDPPERGRTEDDWPFPNEYREVLIEGALADRVRARVGRDAPVYITETVISGGYSEWTQENDHDFEVECGGVTKRFESEGYGGPYDLEGFVGTNYAKTVYVKFDEWLNEPDPARESVSTDD